VEEFG